MTHGTVYAYRRGCRCEECRHTNYSRQAVWRSLAAARPVPETVHGTLNGYRIYGCRCGGCKAANSQAGKQSRDRRRRMRELAAAGLPRDWEGDIPA